MNVLQRRNIWCAGGQDRVRVLPLWMDGCIIRPHWASIFFWLVVVSVLMCCMQALVLRVHRLCVWHVSDGRCVCGLHVVLYRLGLDHCHRSDNHYHLHWCLRNRLLLHGWLSSLCTFIVNCTVFLVCRFAVFFKNCVDIFVTLVSLAHC